MRKTKKKMSTSTFIEYLTKKCKETFKKNGEFGIKKQYLRSSTTCRVTFRLPQEAIPDAQSVTIVGDFNNWDKNETPLKKHKNGTFTVTIELERDKEYQFRYLVDSKKWENDWYADKYVPTPYGDCENSVVVI